MLAAVYLLLIALVAGRIRARAPLLDGLRGAPGYFAAFGLCLFAAGWTNLLGHALLGWGWDYLAFSWAFALAAFAWAWRDGKRLDLRIDWRGALRIVFSPRSWNGWFLFLLGFVVIRFYTGIVADDEGRIWANFNFVDTAFHLSVVNAFLEATQFPPMDLDMVGYPLKYHFLADFFAAHLTQLGLTPLQALWLMNVVSASVLTGTLWAVFESVLKLPPRWVMLGGLIFLFLNTSLVNLIHYLWLKPPYFRPTELFYGLFWFPYFNFEALLTNLFEPQRALPFTMPVALVVLHALFADPPDDRAKTRTLHSFIVICLLPFAHIAAFAVLATCATPRLLKHFSFFLHQWRWWLPVFALGLLQLFYLLSYGPPTHPGFSSWDATRSLPLSEYVAVPRYLQRAVFWFFVNGDFLGWGVFFATLTALTAKNRSHPGNVRMLAFLGRWKWYLIAGLFFFALINYYRYSFFWGDSNKFVLFLNLGLAFLITLGAARWIDTRRSTLSLTFWWFFFLLCVVPHVFSFYVNVLAAPHGKILLFDRNGRAAAAWLRNAEQPGDTVVTAAYNIIHFVTPLAGLPTFAGIYGDSNPYRQDSRQEKIRRIYEEGALHLLRELDATYVCISRNERRKHKLHPRWLELMRSGTGVAFQVGHGPDDHHSVYLFEVKRLPPR